jgi:hypothetical protein
VGVSVAVETGVGAKALTAIVFLVGVTTQATSILLRHAHAISITIYIFASTALSRTVEYVRTVDFAVAISASFIVAVTRATLIDNCCAKANSQTILIFERAVCHCTYGGLFFHSLG